MAEPETTTTSIWVVIITAILGFKGLDLLWAKLVNWNAGKAETKKKQIEAESAGLGLTKSETAWVEELSANATKQIAISLAQAKQLAEKDVEIEALKRVVALKKEELTGANERMDAIVENNGALKERDRVKTQIIEKQEIEIAAKEADLQEYRKQNERLTNANLTGIPKPLSPHTTDSPRFELGTDTETRE